MVMEKLCVRRSISEPVLTGRTKRKNFKRQRLAGEGECYELEFSRFGLYFRVRRDCLARPTGASQRDPDLHLRRQGAVDRQERPEERRVGKGCVRRCRTRG